MLLLPVFLHISVDHFDAVVDINFSSSIMHASSCSFSFTSFWKSNSSCDCRAYCSPFLFLRLNKSILGFFFIPLHKIQVILAVFISFNLSFIIALFLAWNTWKLFCCIWFSFHILRQPSFSYVLVETCLPPDTPLFLVVKHFFNICLISEIYSS